MLTITRQFKFDAAHRVLGHKGACRFLHGHSYIAEVTLGSDKLDDLGMILDYADMKTLIGGWITANWDHNILLHQNDPLVSLYLLSKENRIEGVPGAIVKNLFGGRDPYIMPAGNPTAEMMASVLFQSCDYTFRIVPISLSEEPIARVMKARISETSLTWAECSRL